MDINVKENVAYEVPPSRIKMTENEAYGIFQSWIINQHCEIVFLNNYFIVYLAHVGGFMQIHYTTKKLTVVLTTGLLFKWREWIITLDNDIPLRNG